MKSLLLILFALISNTCIAIEQKITLPEQGKGSGEIVYTSYKFHDRLKSGDSFSIYIGDELAVSFEPNGDFYAGSITTRVRLESSNTIRGVLQRAGGSDQNVVEKHVDITRGFKMPTKCEDKVQYKSRRKGNEHKILFKHFMSEQCHINKIIFSGGSGKLVVNTTSHLTRNPMFILSDTSERSELDITTEVKTN